MSRRGVVSQRGMGKILLSRRGNNGRLTCKIEIIHSSLLGSVKAATFTTYSVLTKCLGMGSLLQIFLHFHVRSILTFESCPLLFSDYRTKLRGAL